MSEPTIDMRLGWVLFLISLTTVQDVLSLNCAVGEYPIYIPNGSYILDLSQVQTDDPKSLTSIDEAKVCQRECDSLSEYDCKSFSFSPVKAECILYPVTDSQPGVTKKTQTDMNYFKGICSKTKDIDKCKTLVESVDLAFVVDGSGSICDNDPTKNESDRINTCNNWVSLKEFIKQIIARLDIGPTKTRVGLVTFANEGNVIFNFNRYTNLIDLNAAVDELKYPGGNTNTYEGLNFMRTVLFANATEGRTKIAFVITDGHATINVNLTEAEAITDRSQGIIMYAVGITTDIDEESLRQLSSPPHQLDRNYFRSTNFEMLAPVVSSLLNASCIRPNPKLYTTTIKPSTEASEPVIDFSQQLVNHPGYIILMMMAAVIMLLFVIAIILLCFY